VRPLADESRHLVYKRYFRPEKLCEELGGDEILFASKRFVMVLADSPAPTS
jgi:hypothetical protein